MNGAIYVMFDYQAGEKQKLLLIMTAVSGVIAGAFFTLLLSPPAEAPQKQSRGGGSRRMQNMERGTAQSLVPLRSINGGMRDNGTQANQPPAADMVEGGAAQSMVQGLLQYMWDFNSSTANQSQEQAIANMTPECAQVYRLNVWTPEIAQKVAAAGMTSSFTPQSCQFVTNNPDGTAVVKIQGQQILVLQGQPTPPKMVIMEYLVKRTPSGLKICGISESGNFGT